jgi:iron(II)-dependent oxidoreductase
MGLTPILTVLIILLLLLISGVASSIIANSLEKYLAKPLGRWPRVTFAILLLLALGTAYTANVLQPNSSPDVDAIEKLATIESQQATIIAVISISQEGSEVTSGTPDVVATQKVQEFIELDATRSVLVSELAEPTTQALLSSSTLLFPSGASLSSTFFRELDAMQMVYVPGGTYLMGAPETDLNAEAFEQPQHRVSVNGFWLDQIEITNAQYSQFLNTTQPDNEQLSNWIEIESSYSQISVGHGLYQVDSNAATSPVVGVSWFGAEEYCRWVGGRLPAEEEWEYAARGPDGLTYPWGNAFDGSSLNFCDVNCPRDWRNAAYDDGYAISAPVGSYASGKSWVGAFDLAGNAAEWTANGLYAYNADADWSNLGFASVSASPDKGFHKVVRGGSWANTFRWARSTYRAYPDPKEMSEFIGFRCVASP